MAVIETDSETRDCIHPHLSFESVLTLYFCHISASNCVSLIHIERLNNFFKLQAIS